MPSFGSKADKANEDFIDEWRDLQVRWRRLPMRPVLQGYR
jgi:hypothetical protein